MVSGCLLVPLIELRRCNVLGHGRQFGTGSLERCCLLFGDLHNFGWTLEVQPSIEHREFRLVSFHLHPDMDRGRQIELSLAEEQSELVALRL